MVNIIVDNSSGLLWSSLSVGINILSVGGKANGRQNWLIMPAPLLSPFQLWYPPPVVNKTLDPSWPELSRLSESLAAQFPTGHLNSNELFPVAADFTSRRSLHWRGHNKSFYNTAGSPYCFSEDFKLFQFNRISFSHLPNLLSQVPAASWKT